MTVIPRDVVRLVIASTFPDEVPPAFPYSMHYAM
jgi:hypothetical protein